jgi:hypothetical protein
MLIIDAKTGTVLDSDDCYVVSQSQLEEDDLQAIESGSDSEISGIARRLGKSLSEIGSTTGWGDLTYATSISFSPLSLREEASVWLESGLSHHAVEDEDIAEALEWCVTVANEDELNLIGQICVAENDLWEPYRDTFIEVLLETYPKIKNGSLLTTPPLD